MACCQDTSQRAAWRYLSITWFIFLVCFKELQIERVGCSIKRSRLASKKSTPMHPAAEILLYNSLTLAMNCIAAPFLGGFYNWLRCSLISRRKQFSRSSVCDYLDTDLDIFRCIPRHCRNCSACNLHSSCNRHDVRQINCAFLAIPDANCNLRWRIGSRR